MSHFLSDAALSDPKTYFSGFTMEYKKIYKTADTRPGMRMTPFVVGKVETSTVSATPSDQSIGSSVKIEYRPPTNKQHKLEGLYLEFDVRNSHATSTCTIFNPFFFLESIMLKINRQEIVTYTSERMMLLVHQYLMKDPDHIWAKLGYCRSELASPTILGEVVVAAAAADKTFKLPLFWLYPDLENLTINLFSTDSSGNKHSVSGIFDMDFEIKFRNPGGGLTVEPFFIKNNSADASIYTTANISIRNIKLRTIETEIVCAPLASIPPQPFYLFDMYDVLTYDVDFSGTTAKLIKLSEFPSRRVIQGIYFFVLDLGSVAAYNDSDACKIKGGPNFLRYSYNKVGDSYTYDLATSLHDLQIHSLMNFKMTYGVEMPEAFIKATSLLDTYWCPGLTYIDFRHMDIKQGHIVLAGENSMRQGGVDYEFRVYAREASLLSSTCKLYAVAHYMQPWVSVGDLGIEKRIIQEYPPS